MQELELLLDNIFQILHIIIFIICSIILFIKSRRLELSEQKKFFIGLAGFALGWSLTHLTFLFVNIMPEEDPLFAVLWKIAACIGILALLSIILVIERYAVKSKYVFSIITLIGLILVIVLPIYGREISGARLASYIFLPIGASSIVFLYLYLIIKLTGEPRRETIYVFIGILLIFFGYALGTELLSGVYIPYRFVINSLLMICGGILVTIVYNKRE
ncbi:MAG: hypothetical protein ACTSYB_11130 [Candidatus Helarchaeota archaeon]